MIQKSIFLWKYMTVMKVSHSYLFLIYNKNTYIIKKNFNLCPE